MRHVVDARGTSVELPDRVGRVVSLVPSLTEWLVVAGVGERLVGVTDWCLEPADALAGLAVFVTMPTTVAGAVAELRDLAAAVGDLPGAAALDAELVAAVGDAYRRRPARRVRYACAVWRDPWMWVGRRTYAADLLGLAGGEPVLDDPATRYPRLDPEALAALGPKLVLLPSEPYEFTEADADELAAGFAGSRVELVDGRALTWYGPRIPAALASFRELLGGAA